MKRILSVCLVLLLMLSLSACKVDWSKFDLTKHNFGLTEDDTAIESTSDVHSVSDQVDIDVITEDVINYIVPENSNIIYNEWVVVSAEDFTDMAKKKLLEIADLVADLTAAKSVLSEYSTVSAMSADEGFLKVLNNIRAWSYGARNYPTDELSDEDMRILNKLILIGVDSAEYGAKLPSLVITNNTETAGVYEELIISQIVELNNILS